MATILIVDDEPLNRELLHAYLLGSGHELIDAGSGEEALVMVEQHRPDLILLDVMLPGMDGFTTTRMIRATSREQFLPIILVTALTDHRSRIEGLRAGADEFLTKPLEKHELCLRVRNMLALRAKETALTLRNVELVELHRFRDEMSAMLVHDLKNPITVMLANVDYLLQAAEPAPTGESLSALNDTQVAGRRALRLLGNLLDVARLESSQLQLRREYTDVARLLGPLVEQRSHMAVSRDISMRCHLDRGATVYADTELISRVVENVFDNAFRHTPVGGVIDVQGFATSHGAQLRIGNSGAAIPSEARQQIFERFAQAHEHVGRMNLGLGLYFCRLATEAHGGRIWVEETRDLPTVFSIELPS